ncbi:MAG: hypothetical protein ACT4QG_19245 [Sporichthyaceae bacterium]
MYAVELAGEAPRQVEALPAAALAFFAELRVVLETAPWSGAPYRNDNPDGPVRTAAFGEGGLIAYLILERQRRVEIFEVFWV